MKQTFNRGFAGVLAAVFLGLATIGGLFGAYQYKQQQEALADERAAIEQLKSEYQQALDQQKQFGAQYEVAGVPYSLYGSGIGTSDTSITLVSFKQPTSGYKLAMADFGTIGYLTLEPGNTTKQEIVSFSGISQNGDGTATLTGVTRGLSPVYPFTASSTLQKSHGGGTGAAISNPPQFYQKYANKENSQTITGVWTYTSGSNPTYSSVPASYANTDFVAYQTLINTAFGSLPVQVTAGGTGGIYWPLNALIVGNGSSALTATSSPTVDYITATSTTATSTFAGGATIGKSLTVTNNINVSGSQTITGNLTVGGNITGTVVVAPFGLLGNAADGSCTYNGTNNLTRDIYCSDITVNGTVYTNGWKIFATGTVSVANGGKISVEGKPGVDGQSGTTVGGGSGGAAATSTGMLGAGSAGGAGGASNGSATDISTSNKVTDTLGGVGGDGGTSPATGVRRTGANASTTLARFLNTTDAMSLMPYSTTTNNGIGGYVRLNGGTGGGGGGGGDSDSGGGGGGGGGAGVLAIFAKDITVASGGTISAIGGAGGNGGTTHGMGGGGGGGGVIVIGYTGTYTNSGTVSAAGGVKGTDQGGGAAGANGSSGTVITLKMQ